MSKNAHELIYTAEVRMSYTGYIRIKAPDFKTAKQKSKELTLDARFFDIEVTRVEILDVFKHAPEDSRGYGTGPQLGPRQKRKKNKLGEVL
jgi:hypothetical protein